MSALARQPGDERSASASSATACTIVDDPLVSEQCLRRHSYACPTGLASLGARA
jgi:hypothetical protein